MKSQLEKAINLAAKTGDRMIIVDELNDRSSVVMSIDDYEDLLSGQCEENNEITGLTEDELLDKINRDIVAWKEVNSDKDFFDDFDGDFNGENLEEDSVEVKEEENKNDFCAPAVNSEEDIIPESEEEGEKVVGEPIENLPLESEVEEAEERPIPEPAEVPEESGEDVYYYHEPEKEITEMAVEPETEIGQSKPVEQPKVEQLKVEQPAAEEKIIPGQPEEGFTSIKDELKRNRKAWAIPEEVKKSAEDENK
jgi:hypothetical protein